MSVFKVKVVHGCYEQINIAPSTMDINLSSIDTQFRAHCRSHQPKRPNMQVNIASPTHYTHLINVVLLNCTMYKLY